MQQILRARLDVEHIPAGPSLGPDCGFVWFVWRKIVTIETIAGVYLSKLKRISKEFIMSSKIRRTSQTNNY